MQKNLLKNWYVIYTRPRCERRVTEQLGRKKIEYYCPLNNAQRLWYDWRKFTGEPLFSSFVFVFISEADQLRVLQTECVVSFMYWLGKPAVIRAEEIDSIKKFLLDFSDVYAEKTKVNLNENVRVLNAPKLIRDGNIVEVRATTVKVLLPSLGYILVAELNRHPVDGIANLTKLEAVAR